MTTSGSPRAQGGLRQSQKGRHPSSSPSSAVIIFAKAPVAGQVKTRLCPPLTPDEAASLHGSLVLDVLERCQSLKGAACILAGTPSSHHPFFRAMEARFKIPVWDQMGDDLGTRMVSVFQKAFDSSYRTAIVIGTDIPGIDQTLLMSAGKSLQDYDVVLGPTVDGGYYLLGLRSPEPELFEQMPWSTNQVYALTKQKIEASGLSVKILPELRDLDTVEDLQAFIQDAKDRQNPIFSSRTKNLLQELSKRLTCRE
jgi:uncharacterized protein